MRWTVKSLEGDMEQGPEKGFSTVAVHGAGVVHDKLGSVVMPIYQVLSRSTCPRLAMSYVLCLS